MGKLCVILLEQSTKPSSIEKLLSHKYEVINAGDSRETLGKLSRHKQQICFVVIGPSCEPSFVLELLTEFKKGKVPETIPVIVVSAIDDVDFISDCYDLDAMSFIRCAEDPKVIFKKFEVGEKIFYQKKKLLDAVIKVLNNKRACVNFLLSVFTKLMEIKQDEGYNHSLRIGWITEILLNKLREIAPQYNLKVNDIPFIVEASSLHDIGKLSLPESLLNKRGRFTPEESRQWKQHPIVGSLVIESVECDKNTLLYQYSLEICKWHHERWDGSGYPDGIKGDKIPISAQVVGLAECLDSLVADKPNRQPVPFDTAIDMITYGQHGSFNPDLLEALDRCRDKIKEALENNTGPTGLNTKHQAALAKKYIDN